MSSPGRLALENLMALLRDCGNFSGDVLFVGRDSEYDWYKTQFFEGCRFQTLDIDPDTEPDIVGDICDPPEGAYDWIICNGVMEEVANPFEAMKGLRRLLKPRGRLLLGVLGNLPEFRPPNDNLRDKWRFTAAGLDALLGDMHVIHRLNVKGGWFYAVAVKP